MAHEATRVEGRASASAIRSWQVQSSAVAGDDGSVISAPRYRAAGWYETPSRSTVMAALLANGLYPGVEFSTRLRDDVDASQFECPWWFRTTLLVSGDASTVIRSDGIIPKADLFLNGKLVAGSDVIAGAYTTNSFDVTPLVRRGLNALAYRVHPGNPNTDLSVGWVDWNQWPPDNNMGVWRDVWILRSGAVSVSRPRIRSELSHDIREARLVVSADVTNRSDSPVTVALACAVSGPHAAIDFGRSVVIDFGRSVVIDGGRTERVSFSAEDTPALSLREPALWWPLGEGQQPLYDLEITASIGSRMSDRTATSFGIRAISSFVADGGGRQFVVNGRSIAIRGAGWSPDLFLRFDRRRLTDELGYAADIGLNTIRLEGKLENPEFFELCDESGLLVLPGWECCDKWEAHAGTGGAAWTDHDFDVAARSMSSEADRLANHACVAGFFIGSDYPPEPRAARSYVEALSEARWDLPVISSATSTGCDEAGPSGMKMTGPYAWVPPSYWYLTDPERGGAIGFNSETSAGNNIPRLPTLSRMLSSEALAQLWTEPTAKQFHAGPPSEFDNIAIFHRALAGRYGAPRDLRDFVAKAQLASYEATRAQFEAYASRESAEAPATGVVYWMLNSAWPSLNWQIWDYFLDPSAAYFGVKKANEPMHIQYAYDEAVVKVLNRTRAAVSGLVARATVRDCDGTEVWSETALLEAIEVGGVVTALEVAVPAVIGPTYFLELELGLSAGGSADGASTRSRNVYWLSTVPDVLDFTDPSWQYTPVSSFADLRGLESLAAPGLEVSASFGRAAGSIGVRVVLANPTHKPVIGVHASLVASDGRPIAPILWDDNDVVLFGGQSALLSGVVAESSLAVLGGRNGAGQWSVAVDAFGLDKPVVVRAEPAGS